MTAGRAGRLLWPASLRGRVLAVVLLALLVLLVLLFVAVDVALRARLDSELRTRLTDRSSLARSLGSSLTTQQLADRLAGDGVAVQLCQGGGCVQRGGAPALPPADAGATPPGPRGPKPGAPGPPALPAPPGPDQPVQVGQTIVLVTRLPDGAVLTLTARADQVQQVLSRLVGLEVLGGLAMLAVAAGVLWLLVGRALRPLDAMTSTARTIAAGGPVRTLALAPAGTELGRTGAAFDDMVAGLRGAERRALAARAEAVAAEQRMRAFLSDASHELRTPLAGLSATAEVLLREQPAEPERERMAAALVRESRRAGRLVSDLLTVARMDTEVPLQLGPVDLRELAVQEVERVRGQLPELRAQVLSGPAVPLRADVVRLAQVLGNLLDNAAAAAGPRGRVQVDVRPLGDRVQVDVDDDGPGVPEADRERIFDRLVRLDTARGHQNRGGGFGLGLPIARRIAEACAGTLECCPPGTGLLPGARFRLVLPTSGP